MSVRRLWHEQPDSFAFSDENAAWAEKAIKRYPDGRQASAVIPLLWKAQEQEGWVSEPAIRFVADMLAMPYIRVLEVATFYTMFQLQPVGRKAHVQVCGTTPCRLRGAGELIAICKRRIAENPHDLSADGDFSWEEVECLGACVNAPMVMIFKDTYEDLTPERLEEIIDEFEAGRGDVVRTGPQNTRMVSAPESGLTSLTEEVVAVKSGRRASTAKTGGNGSRAGAKKAEKNGAAASSGVTRKSPVTPKPADSGANRPAAVEKPASPDDLKLISGVGPKLEGVLNGLGIFTYAQVASWKKAERDWVDNYLKFKGRIERDDWVKQAKALAKGGVDEYVRVFGKKPR